MDRGEQRRKVATAMESYGKLKEGEFWAIIPWKWYEFWTKWSGYSQKVMDSRDAKAKKEMMTSKTDMGAADQPTPDLIPTRSLSGEKYQILKRGIMEYRDFVALPAEVYNLLKGWYGVDQIEKKDISGKDVEEPVEFLRKVCVRGLRQEEYVALYPKFITICGVQNDGKMDNMKYLHPCYDGDILMDLKERIYKAMFNADMPKPKEDPDKKKKDSKFESSGPVLTRFWCKKDEEDNKMDTATQKREQEKSEKDGFELVERATDEWKEVPLDYMSLPIVQLDQEEFLIEFRAAEEQPFPRKEYERPWTDYRIGDIIECKDTVGKWYRSQIRDIKYPKLLIHFIGWAQKWDQWVDGADLSNVSKNGTHCEGNYIPQAKREGRGAYASSNDGEVGKPLQRGVVGLRNLGNTCFMNSTIQCVSGTEVLTEYFMDGKYVKDINVDNPLGWNGKVAKVWASLLKSLWGNQYSVVSPRDFKQVIGEVAPRFQGVNQQDSSELLSFFMDGLHEDLNRVKKKPFTEAVESNGRPDKVVAGEAWETHQKRHDSIIVDKFQGQYKSTVRCSTPNCGRVSITFDPFMFLSVPLPEVETTNLKITFVPKGGDKPHVTKTYTCSNFSTFDQLAIQLCESTEMEPENLRFVDVYQHGIVARYPGGISVRKVGKSDVTYCYDLGKQDLKANERMYPVTGVHYVEKSGLFKKSWKRTGAPFLLPLHHDAAMTTVGHLKEQLKTFCSGFAWDCEEMPFELRYDGTILEKDDQKIKLTKSGKVELFWKEDAYKKYYVGCTKENIHKPEGAAAKAKKVELSDCLELFTADEKLSKNDEWYCSKCKKFNRAMKQMQIWKSSEVLIIHLKRFRAVGQMREKVTTPVNFPMDLDLNKYLQNEEKNEYTTKYELYAVSCHGGGLQGGHYWAYVKNIVDGKWYNCDDSRVKEMSEKDVVCPEAFVLYYRQKKN